MGKPSVHYCLPWLRYTNHPELGRRDDIMTETHRKDSHREPLGELKMSSAKSLVETGRLRVDVCVGLFCSDVISLFSVIRSA